MKVGIMLMSDRGPDGERWDWVAHLKRCKEHGLEVVDLFEEMLKTVGTKVVEAKKILEDLGLSPSVYSVNAPFMSPDPQVQRQCLETVKRGIESCQELEVQHLFIYGWQDLDREEARACYIEGLSKAADFALEAGITLSIENFRHWCPTDAELLRCLEEVGKPNLKITFDGGNFILADCDPHKAAESLAEKVVHVHVKSFIPAPEKSKRAWPDLPYQYCPIGYGLVDYRRIGHILIEAGFNGCMSFEPEGGEHSRWYESLDTLTSIVKGLADESGNR